MRIKSTCCIGVGNVGEPIMDIIAQKCPDVKATFVDINEAVINAWNEQDSSKLPVYEPALDGIVVEAGGRNFFFSTIIDKVIDEVDAIFMTVNSPAQTYYKGKGMTANFKYLKHLFYFEYFKDLSPEVLHKSEFEDFSNLIEM